MVFSRENNRNEEEEVEVEERNKKTLGRENNKIVEKGIKKLSRAIKLKRERGK